MYYSMRDVNEDYNSSSWPLSYGDKALTNGHYYNGFTPRTITEAYPGCEKDAIKQKMLEHEAVFKNQVYELHRLYRRQRDMMEEVKRKEYHKHRISVDASSSSTLLPSQKPYEDAHKWQIPSLPLANSTCARPSIFGAELSNNSPLSGSKDCEVVECRPSKVRKKLFDLELPPDEIIDQEENVQNQYKQASEESSYKATSSGQCFRGSNGLADLNEPLHVEEGITHMTVDGLGPSSKPSTPPFLGQTHELFKKSQSERPSGPFNPLLLDGKGTGRDWLSNSCETGNSRSNKNFTPGTYSEMSIRIQDHTHLNQTPLPFTASLTSSSCPYMNSSALGNSWGKPNGSFTHKFTSFQKQPAFLSSPQSHVVFGDNRRTNGCYTSNGFYRGSSSGSKEVCTHLPSSGFDNRTGHKLDDRSQKISKGLNFIDLTDSNRGMDLNTVETALNDDNSVRKCDETVLPWLQAKPVICKNESPCDQSKNGEFDCGEKHSSMANNEKIIGFPFFRNSCVSKNDSSSLISTSASLRCAPENGKIKTEIEPKGFDMNVAWDDPENNQIYVETCNLEKETNTEIEKVKNHFDLNSCVTEDEDFLVPASVKSSSEKVKKMPMEIDLEAPAVPEAEEEAIDEVKNLDGSDDELLAKVAAKAIVAISSQQDEAGPSSETAHSDDIERLRWFVDVIENAGSIANELDEYEELTLQLEETKEEDYMPKPLAPDFREPGETGSLALPTRPRRGQARRGRPRRDFQRDVLPGLVSLSRHEVTEDLQIFGGLMRATGHSWNVGVTRSGKRGRRKTVAVAVGLPPPAATPPPPPAPPLSEQLNSMEAMGLEEGSLTGWGKATRRPRRQRCAAGTSVMAVPST